MTIYHQTPSSTTEGGEVSIASKVLWDRKTDGGFPETKELKRRVRDVVEPGRDLGHVDRGKDKKEGEKKKVEEVKKDGGEKVEEEGEGKEKKCEDCV